MQLWAIFGLIQEFWCILGHYYHFGVKHCVEQCLACDPKLQQLNKLNLQVNIDGLLLFKSSSMQLWAIFGLIQEFWCILGHYYHFGVKHCVEQCLACDPKLQQLNTLNL